MTTDASKTRDDGKTSGAKAPDIETLKQVLDALAADFELLAILHDREPDEAMLCALRACSFEQQLSLQPESDDMRTAFTALNKAISDVPEPATSGVLDELAVGYADVYLRHTYRVSPTESFWLTEDRLERQGPMLDIRAEYRRNELRLTDWAGRPEDHVVPQLRFLAHKFSVASKPDDVTDAIRFLDRHLLRWVKSFAAGLVAAGAPDFYAALAVVTAAYLDGARELLGAATGIARPPEVGTRPSRAAAAARTDEDRPYVPGVAPSW